MSAGDIAVAVRWTARVASAVSLLLLAAFAFGPHERGHATRQEWVGLAFFPIGVALGLLVAWRYELAGALLAVGSLGAFYVVYGWWIRGALPRGPYFFLFTAPAVLFLIASLLTRRGKLG